jgi:phosphoglycolate phosphatase-like HAD superfamily hydrolase
MLSLALLALAQETLPSWREGPAREAVLDFVRRAAAEVPPAERVAVVDNDGTLWSEQPVYVQFAFVLDRVKALAARHPEWKDRDPFKRVLEGKPPAEKDLAPLLAATHAGMSTDDFRDAVEAWLSTARHPRFRRPYTDLVYQPMLELLRLLKAKGFTVYIVSGGGVDFMRVFAERVYGIPPERVVGSAGKTVYEDGVLRKRPGIDFVDDGPGKPVGIHRHVGRRPILAVGNSDGDLGMLQWTTSGAGPRLGVLVRHTDAEREWAYDRASAVGRLDRALDAAPDAGWIVVDMKRDWRVIYPFQEESP